MVTGPFERNSMKRLICRSIIVFLIVMIVPATTWARGTRYVINWPEGHVGPVYVQVFDIRCHYPYELLDRFKVWVSWDKETKCYDIGNRGTYLLQMYKYDHCKGPMIISGNGASFQIRYSMTPPWI
jgi:hypothetical protein